MSIMNKTQNVKNQFSNDKNLAMRIDFYKKYTTNKYKFADWLFDKYEFKENFSILELGCGNGSHWEGKIEKLPIGCKLILSDFSDGMCFLCIPAGSKADYRSNQRTGNAPVPDIIVTCQSMLIQPSAGQFCKKYIRQIADQ